MFDDSSNSLKQFRFDIVNGVVAGFFEVENGIEQQESIESQDTFEINGNQIIHTETKSDGIETTVYIDEDDDGLYVISSTSSPDDASGSNSDDSSGRDSDDSSGSNSDDSSGRDSDDSSGGGRKAFVFETANGEVTGVFEVKDGQLKPDPIESNESYTIDGTDIIRTEIEAFGTEIKRYSDPDGDGQYHRVSEQWIPSSDNPGGPVPVIDQTLLYISTDSDDLIAVRGDDSVKGGLGADSFVIRVELGKSNHWHIEDFHSSEDDRLVFDTGLGLTSKEHLASLVTQASFEGENFFIGFTPEISITLVGVTPGLIGWEHVDVLS